MNAADFKSFAVGSALLIGAVMVLYIWRRGPVGAADDLISGVVKGVGGLVGIPDTNKTECQKALAEGRYWDASFVCPAADLVKGVFSTGAGAGGARNYDDGPGGLD